MLPLIGMRLTRPPLLEHTRDIEIFDGPLLSELRDETGSVYVEKWCSRDQTMHRTLVVRSDQRSVSEYIGGRLTLRNLLVDRSGGVGFLCDYTADGFLRATMVEVTALPPNYLPKRGIRHDPSLRPNWKRVPQEFLIDQAWDANVLHKAEKLYHEVSAFIHAAHNRPEVIRDYLTANRHDSGWTYGKSFAHLRKQVPLGTEPRTVGVHAASPGVLSMNAPRSVARDVNRALIAAREQPARKAYNVLHAWSKTKTDNSTSVPKTAQTDIKRLCGAIGIDAAAILSGATSLVDSDESPGDDLSPARKKALLQIGKLVAAYHRRLLKMWQPATGVEFLVDRSLIDDWDEDDWDEDDWDEDDEDEDDDEDEEDEDEEDDD